MEISFEEIAIWCRNEKKRMWEFMLEEDMRDRKVTMEKSFAEMERIFEAMMDAINTYKGDRVSASGLVGGTGARLEQYFEQEDVLCGGYMGEAMVTALKMAESNACMRRIVAAPTAGSCGVIPAVLVPYYNRGMAGWQEIIKALYVAGCVGEVIAARASVSGAEGGCQAEIGSASAMAAGALVFLRGGSDEHSKLPDNKLLEVAFAGKSNVGKSSLINALMNRKSLARTSAQPGKTQTINYYNINNELYFVDLPGYGYAKANENVKAQWGKMIEDYLHRSKKLQLVFLLVDIRHAPSENDRIMYNWICKMGYSPVIIATKLDKINRSQIQKQLKLIRTGLNAEQDTVMIPFSATTKQGREEIYDLLDQLLEQDRQENQEGEAE